MDGLPVYDPSISTGAWVILGLALLIALAFEFVNGFHDTANAVATVIYTRSLGPRKAVAWSGFCNFLGVALGGTAVAFSIVSLLPVELLVSVDSARGMAMILALLLSAIAWNLGTWYLGLPASSSHTLIGAILGVGLANSALPGHSFGSGVNWSEAGKVGLSLLISPVVGFACAAGLLLALKRLIPVPELYRPPEGDQPPPPWIRGTLLLTCTGVSLAHGSNDGQKGIGLIMLVLIAVIPGQYALDQRPRAGEVERIVAAVDEAEGPIRAHVPADDLERKLGELDDLREHLTGKKSLAEVVPGRRWELRANLIRVDQALDDIRKRLGERLPAEEMGHIEHARRGIRGAVYYAPTWVMIAVALSLSLGTTVGWKRIVTTIGEKIGKTHLTYAQGAAAELVAMTTIGLADYGGLPVSTTHVLSSGVAGTMAANGSSLQWSTVRNIALAWILTLPACIALAAGLYLLFRWLSA